MSNQTTSETVERKPELRAIGETIRWIEEDNKGRKTYRSGKIISVENDHPLMPSFYEVEGCDYRIRQDCARFVS